MFNIMLWLISLRIYYLSLFNKEFKYAIKDKKILLQFETLDNKVKRYFEFNKGKFISKSRIHQNYSLAETKGMLGERIIIFSFSTDKSAMSIFMKSAKNDAEMLKAVQEKRLIISGDFTLFIWFGWLAKQL